MMCSDALEVAPSGCSLVLLYSRFGHFDSEVVFGYTVESSYLYIRRQCTFADNAADTETVCKSSAFISIFSLITYIF